MEGGKIPATLADARSLTHLQLDSNGFSGTLPARLIVDMPALKILSAKNNSLTGAIANPRLRLLEISQEEEDVDDDDEAGQENEVPCMCAHLQDVGVCLKSF